LPTACAPPEVRASSLFCRIFARFIGKFNANDRRELRPASDLRMLPASLAARRIVRETSAIDRKMRILGAIVAGTVNK